MGIPAPTDQDCSQLERENKTAILAAAERLAKLRGWCYDVASRRLRWSPGAAGVLALSQGEPKNLSRSRFFRRVHPEDRPALVRLAREVLSGERRTFSFRYRLLAAAGEPKSIVGNGEALLGGGERVQRVVGSLMDISDHERTRRACQAGEARISTLEESSSVWLWEQDDQFRFTMATRTRNPALNEWHGDILGRHRWDTPGAVPCEGTWADHRNVLRQHLPFHDFEYRLRLGSAERIFATTGVPAYGADGRFTGYRGTASDVTELRAAQQRARHTESLLALASRLGRVGAWALDLAPRRGTWSSELSTIYEFEGHQDITPQLLLSLAAAERRDAIAAAMRACAKAGTPVDIEFASLTAKGRPVWLHLTAEAVRDSSGAVVRLQGAVQDITERQEHAQRLTALNDRLTATFESITDGFVTLDRQLRFTYVNGPAERRSGLSRADLLGKSLLERFPSFQDSVFRHEFDRALREGTAGTVEAYSPVFRRWLSVEVYPSAQELALHIRDVTDSKNAQRELVDSEERYRLLFETSADAIVKARPDGRIRHANRSACQMFGRTEAQMCKLLSQQLVCPGDHERLQAMVRERLRGGGASGELTMMRADGSPFEAEVSTSTYCNRHGQTFINIVVRDATERIQLRQRLLALNEDLARKVRHRTRELERANSELEGFARSLAHDLRQPITASKSFAFALEAALAKNDGDKARRYAVQIGEATQWMGNYVEALLSMARIAQSTLTVEDVDLSGLAAGLLQELAGQSGGRQVQVRVQPGLRAPGDRTLLRLLLQNLLGNAWKFTGRQDPARISFTAAASEQGELVYSVQDNGAGFDSAHAERLFETFQRFHKGSDFPGTGIGLANARKIVSRHGGRIWATSAPGEGATFCFTLGDAGGTTTTPGALD